MKEMKAIASAPKKLLGNGANGFRLNQNGEKIARKASSFQYPHTELEVAIQRYVDLYEFAPTGCVRFDPVGQIEEVNFAAVQLLGRPRNRLVGSPFEKFLAKADAHLFRRHLLHCRRAKQRIETELRLKTPRGGTVPIQIASVPIHSLTRDGTLLYQTAIVDLTERKRAEDSIRQSELRYRTLFDFVPVAVYACNAQGLIQEFSQGAVELWGREPKTNDHGERFCGSFKIFYPDGRPMPHAKCPMARVLRGEKLEASDLEIVVERSSGERRNVLVSPIALKDRRRKIIGAINCLHDITQRKRTETALRESEERSRAIIHQSAAGIGGSDLKGRLILVNRKFCEMLGYTESELIGKSIVEITHADEVAESRRLFRRIVEQGQPYELEKRYIRKDGSSLWVCVSASPIRDAAGKTQATVAVILDITDRKKAQAILEERARGLEGEILEISDREQRRLGQDLHDSLCQHLAATAFMVRSMAMRLKNHRVLDVNDLERIAELINEGVTEARTIARGLHPVEMESTGLMTALQSLVDQKHWLVQCRFEADEEISIQDATVALHLYRIAREAVINANKHARAREITVELRARKKGIELSVTDDGKGVKASDMRKRTGLGFHIMEYRARSMGAQLLIERVQPRGTCVTCRLPRK
jgi:PAS domain S-box-containing protein